MGYLAGAQALMGGGKASQPLRDIFGIGAQGEYYQPGALPDAQPVDFGRMDELERQSQSDLSELGRADLAQQGAAYGLGQGGTGEDLLRGRSALGIQEAETGGLSGSRLAAEAVRSNPLLAGAYGQGGLMEQVLAEQKRLAEQGPRLGEKEYTAYGQAAGDIARRSGQQEQSLAQALARRGLGTSGAAGAGFSGLMGNKFEQLGQLQTNIAQKAQEEQFARLKSARDMAAQLSGQAGSELQSQFGRQLAGREASEAARSARTGDLKDIAGMKAQAGLTQQELALKRALGGEELEMQSLASKLAGQTPTLGQAFGRGATGSFQEFGAAPGRFSKSFASSAGSSAGKGSMGG